MACPSFSICFLDDAGEMIIPPRTGAKKAQRGLSGVGGLPRDPRGPARCLFGTPDPKTALTAAQKAQAVQAWSFSKRWNFNVTGKPEPPTVLESSTNSQPTYSWEYTYDSNQMAKCDRHRCEVPVAPKGRAVPLLIAPTEEPIEINLDVLLAPSVSVQTDNTRVQVDKGTQVTPPNSRKRKGQFSATCNGVTYYSRPVTDEDEFYPGFRKERRLPVPLTIPPVSPDQSVEEHEEDDDDQAHDDTFSPVPEKPNAASHKARSPRKVFTFPTIVVNLPNNEDESPAQDESKTLKQKTITEYMQVKKNIPTLASPKNNKGKNIQ